MTEEIKLVEKTLEEIKEEISEITGIPVFLLDGETVEENIIKAKALLAYKREKEGLEEAARKKTNSEAFAEIFKTWAGEEETPSDPVMEALCAYEQSMQVAPVINDQNLLSTNHELPDPRPTREQFSEFMKNMTAFDPFKEDGWTPLH